MSGKSAAGVLLSPYSKVTPSRLRVSKKGPQGVAACSRPLLI